MKHWIVFLETHVLEPSDVIAFGLQIAAGLEAAHAKGIVHRDIKPGNVFVTRAGGIKITDFGLALIAPPAPGQSVADTAFGDLTMPGSSVGTAAYMSPEQARGETVDARTDVFALGLVLFQMATGRPAFSGATLATVFDAVLNHTPPFATSIAPRVPVALSHVIAKALEKDREQRYQRVSDLSADLQRIANGAAISPPVTAPDGAVLRRRGLQACGGSSSQARSSPSWLGPAMMWWSSAHSPSSQRARAPIHSLAVLPLENLSGGSDNDYFTDGMTEELITALAAVRGWRVISRTSVMPYKHARKPLPAIARELGVDAIVEGSIQQSGQRVRITAKLVRAGDAEENLWAGNPITTSRTCSIWKTSSRARLPTRFRITLTPQEQQRLTTKRPVDPELFQLLLKGRAAAQTGAEDDLFKAIGYFEQALALKPDYAPAHAAMALAYEGLTPAFRAPKEVPPKAREHAVRAIELDASLSEAHAALADVMFMFDWDWANAGTEMQRAIELNPNSASAHELYGNYLAALNQKEAAISELTLAHQLNPAGLATYLHCLVRSARSGNTIARSPMASCARLHPISPSPTRGWACRC